MILSDSSKNTLLMIVAIAMGMEMLDANILNTSLPQIAHSLQVNPIQLKAALTTYLLSLGIFVPVSGWLSDRIGEKHTLMLAIIIFVLSSIGCGLSHNLPMMVFFRLCQGIGGAFLMPVGRLILIRIFQGQALVVAIAKVSGYAVLGSLLGPVIGGALTTYLHWRWIFFINIPVGFIGLYLVYYHLPIFRERLKQPFDLPGFLLIGFGLGALLFLLDKIPEGNFNLIGKYLLFVFIIGAFLGYYWHARYAKNPLIRLDILKQKYFMTGAIGSLLARLTLSAQSFLVPLLLQTGYGYSALHASFFLIPQSIGILLNKPVVTRLLKYFGHKRLLFNNTLLLTLLLFSYVLQTITLMPMLLLFQQLVIGFAMSLHFTVMNSYTYDHLPEAYVSDGSSFYSGVIQVSSSFGIALAALVMLGVIGNTQNLHYNVPLHAFAVVFVVQTIYLMVAGVLFQLKIPSVS